MRHPSEGVLRRLVDEPAGGPAGHRAQVASRPPCPPPAAPARRGWRTAVRRPAVAALSAVVLLTGAGVAAANDWLPIFQTESVDPVEITSTDLVQVPDLSAYGDLQILEEPEPEQVADA